MWCGRPESGDGDSIREGVVGRCERVCVCVCACVVSAE